MSIFQRLYPKAGETALHFRDPVMVKTRHKFFRAAGQNFALLQILFLVLFSWVFGSLYLQLSHTHNLTIAFVDYDGGAIGDAVRTAYEKLRGDTFPVIAEQPAQVYPTPSDLWTAVCGTDYWAAVYVQPGSSERLQAALTGSSPATLYNRTDVLRFIWNEARYATVADASIQGNLVALSDAARIAFSTGDGTGNITSIASPGALSILVNPWQLTGTNIKATTQGSRAIYNTLVIILILIQEFFYLGTINGMYAGMKIFAKAKPWIIVMFRMINSVAYCFIGSLCVTGAIWAFRAGWDVNGGQFMLNWMALWLFAHLNFVTLDVFTIWLPIPYVPMALITWILVNVTSILLPLELSPGFYKIGYMLPAHAVFQVLTDIWSGGCNPFLYYSLPVMFAWEIVGVLLSTLGVFRRSHYARLGELQQEAQMKERVDAAVAHEREVEREHSQWEKKREEEAAAAKAASTDGLAAEKTTTPSPDGEDAETQIMDREGWEEVISNNEERQRVENRKASICNFGPSFGVAFAPADSDSDDGIKR